MLSRVGGVMRIITTHSCRGGTGVSTIVANLAVLLAERGHRVGVIDAAVYSPGLHVLLGLDHTIRRFTLSDYLQGRGPVEEAVVDVTDSVLSSMRTNSSGRIFFVPASMRNGDIAHILKHGYSAELLNEGIQSLGPRFALDFLLIDTQPGVNGHALLSIALSDALLLVLRPDHQDYQGMTVTLDLVRRLEVPQLLLVVNKVLAVIHGSGIEEDISAACRTPVAAVLPLAEELIRLGSKGVLAAAMPTAPFIGHLRQVVALLDESGRYYR